MPKCRHLEYQRKLVDAKAYRDTLTDPVEKENLNKDIASLMSEYSHESLTMMHHEGKSLFQAPRKLDLQESMNLCAAARLQFQDECAPTIGYFADAESEENLFRGSFDETETGHKALEFMDEHQEITRKNNVLVC